MSMPELPPSASPQALALLERIAGRTAIVGVIGLGYVGLPLASACARANFKTIGFDVDPEKPVLLNAGTSYIEAVGCAELAGHVKSGLFTATTDMARLNSCDIIVICVPTPLTQYREPDMSYIVGTAGTIARHQRPGQLVVLESTTYPGTTDEVVRPILEAGGLHSGRDVFLGFSPEREDPGNQHFETVTIPKVVAGDGPSAQALAVAFYGAVVKKVVPVSTPAVAEAVKITENIFRSVNIALANELKVIFEPMGIDVWEVIDAAKTKPFGFMPFYPGPGLGGHCIPIDPFYLTWKAREFGVVTRFIELAGEINSAMPRHVLEKLALALDRKVGRGLNGAKILVVGLAYKKNVSDTRESPSLRLMDMLEARGALVSYFDPHVPVIPKTREHMGLAGRESITFTSAAIASFDAALIVTDHDTVDYADLCRHAKLVVDTRNVCRRMGVVADNVVLA